ncbi:MAG: hypothetical protein AB1894_13610 [Chloroflexota bacterium]
MHSKKLFQYLWLISILVVIALGCSMLSGVVERQIEKGIETEMESIGTEVDALITDMGGEGMIDTMAAEFTDIPFLDETGIPFFDETEEPMGEKPADIPVMPGAKMDFTSPTSVEYGVEAEIKAAVDFYEREMPVNGWIKVEAESKVDLPNEMAKLVFQKEGRKATVEIEVDFLFDGTYVTISIVGG